MKILAKFLLPGVFVSLPVVACAQDILGLHDDCGFAPALKMHTTDLNGKVSPQIVEMLEDGQNCLNVNLIQLKASLESLHTQMGWKADSDLGFRDDIQNLQDKLKQTEHDLDTAETKIETLEDMLGKAEDEIQELQSDFQIPPHRAIKRSDASKLSGFIPDTPATTPHPASKKSDASKPTAPVIKPKPAVKEGTQ